MWLNLSYKNSIITLSFLKNFPSTKTNQTNQLLRDIFFNYLIRLILIVLEKIS
jgi:hypothetical protein